MSKVAPLYTTNWLTVWEERACISFQNTKTKLRQGNAYNTFFSVPVWRPVTFTVGYITFPPPADHIESFYIESFKEKSSRLSRRGNHDIFLLGAAGSKYLEMAFNLLHHRVPGVCVVSVLGPLRLKWPRGSQVDLPWGVQIHPLFPSFWTISESCGKVINNYE